jgi:cytochrome b involved in lipid metabolism/uncharacterized membrane protein
MNLHPIIVHFPIALLIVYSLLELLSLFSQARAAKLYTTKIICLRLGTLWSFFALQSGEIAQELFGRSILISQHEEFAEKSHLLYSFLSIVYLIISILRQRRPDSKIVQLWYSRWARWLYTLVALIGMWVLTIVWALWGAIVRGTDGDMISKRAVTTFVGDTKSHTSWWDQNLSKNWLVVIVSWDIDQDSKTVENNITTISKEPASLPTSKNDMPIYTIDQIQEHNKEESCWTVIRGKVYDLTAFADKHPWGDRNIFKICGKDGTSAFENKHGWKSKPEQTLQWFEIWIIN